MKKLIWLMPVLLAMLVTGCLKDEMDGKTIVLMGTESDVQPIDNVIPDTLLNFLMDPAVLENPLPIGNMPPDIQGEYLFGPRELYAYNDTHQLEDNDTLYFRFGGAADTLSVSADTMVFQVVDTIVQDGDTVVTQHDSIVVVNNVNLYYPYGQHNRVTPCDILENSFPRESISKAFVMGEGDQFTAYFTVKYVDLEEPNSGAKFSLTRGYIITGTVTESGIDHAVVASINIDAESNAVPSSIPNDFCESMKGQIFVYRVKTNDPSNPFGSAVREKWY